MTDKITILKHASLRLCKLWRADGTISSYEDAKNYKAKAVEVKDLRDLSRLLTALEAEPTCGVIRGVPNDFNDPEAAPGKRRKIKAAYDDAPHHWLMLDLDDVDDGDIDAALARLVPELAPYSYHWQLSNSSGHPSKKGISAHVWFWLAEPRTSEELKAWAPAGVDKAVFNSVQFHYTANPQFDEGVDDPTLGIRSGFVEGLFGDVADVAIERRATALVTTAPLDDNDAWLMSLKPGLGATLDELRALLFRCPPDTDREHWLKALMALHHETNGSDDGFALADEWSSGASSYKGSDDVLGRWNSFAKGNGGVTGIWLKKWASEFAPEERPVEVLRRTVKETTDPFVLRERVCAEIAATELDPLDREALAQLLVKTFFGLEGTKYPLATVRTLITPQAVKSTEMPPWALDWVWVTDKDKFYKIDTDEWVTKTSFDACHNRFLGIEDDSAARWALDVYSVPTATRGMYLPWGSSLFTTEAGVSCVNTYRPSSVPQAADSISPEGRQAINLWVSHIELTCGGRPEVIKHLLSWMAFNVQKPGTKIRHAPLIKGIEGDGKSMIGDLMRAVMGSANVKTVSPKVLGTDFSAFAEGACLVLLEEIKLTGHNRYDILNALKPYITNSSVPVHRKGIDEYETINTTNYLGFTNFNDALPLGETDRRWMIVFTPWQVIGDLAAKVGNTVAYFAALVAAMEGHRAELRRFFLDYAIDPSFQPNAPAPMTDEKAEMVAMNRSEHEDIVSQVISQGGSGVSDAVLTTASLTAAIGMSGVPSKLETSRLSGVLSKLGYRKVPDQLKWKGWPHRVWVKGVTSTDPAELRRLLDLTLEPDLFLVEDGLN